MKDALKTRKNSLSDPTAKILAGMRKTPDKSRLFRQALGGNCALGGAKPAISAQNPPLWK
jgi:hypothetical protein